MSKEQIRLIALCTAFVFLDVIVFTMVYLGSVKRQELQERYLQAVEQYESASAIYDENGLSVARSLFLALSGYKDSEAYVSKIDDELQKMLAYRDAVALCEGKKYSAAYATMKPILGYRNVDSYVDQISSEILSDAKRYVQEDNLEEALVLLGYVPEYASNYYGECRELFQKVSAELEERDRKKAAEEEERKKKEAAEKEERERKEAEEKEEREKRKKYELAAENYEKENYKVAMTAFAELGDYLDAKDYLKKIEEKSEQAVEKALSDAETEYRKTHDVNKVIEILAACEDKFGADERIRAAIDDYNHSIVYLSELDTFNYSKDGAIVNQYLKSNYGETYKNSVTCSQGYISYLIDGKGYSAFRGIVGCPEGKHSDAFWHGAYVEIIGAVGDSQTSLYVTNEITDASKPTAIEIDVSGYEVIYFKWHCVGANIWSNWGEYATIFEGMFLK